MKQSARPPKIPPQSSATTEKTGPQAPNYVVDTGFLFFPLRRAIGQILNPLADCFSLAFSKPAKQDKDQQDNNYETKPTAAVISGPIERAASEPTEATKQQDD
jgi:hypothetical protein